MKWFKDKCDSLDSNFEQELILNFGGNGYLVYYGVLKMVCKEAGYDKLDGELTIEGRLIKQKLHVSLAKVEQILEFCSTKGKVFFNKTSTKVQQKSNKTKVFFNFKIPNILELKDNHSSNLQVTDKQLAPKKREVRSKKVEEPKPLVTDEKIKPLKPKPTKPKFSDWDLKIAKWIYQEALLNVPSTKKPNMEIWANEIRLMRDADGRPKDSISRIFDWARCDDFWNAQIRSPQALRKHHDTLWAKRNSNVTKY